MPSDSYGAQKLRAYRQRHPERVAEENRRRRAAKQAWQREHYVHPCVECGKSTHRGTPRCVDCYHAAKRAALNEKRAEIQRLWRDGLTHGEIAAALGTTKGTIVRQTVRMRKDGWDLPRRKPGRRRVNAA